MVSQHNFETIFSSVIITIILFVLVGLPGIALLSGFTINLFQTKIKKHGKLFKRIVIIICSTIVISIFIALAIIMSVQAMH